MRCRSVTFQPFRLVLLSTLAVASVSATEPNAKVRAVCTTTNDIHAPSRDVAAVAMGMKAENANESPYWVCGLLLGWWRRRRDTRRRIQAEDALKHLHANEWADRPATHDSLAGSLSLSPRAALALVMRMEAQGLLRTSGDALRLTPAGTRLALEVIRAHRLWERYLVDEARMPLADVHAEAERLEHVRSIDALDAFDAALGHPSVDPHGDPIPTVDGELERVPAKPITDWPVDAPARIVHLEDEPAAIFAQIDALGFRPGDTLRVLESDARRIVLSDGEEAHVLAPAVAGNIFVTSAAAAEEERKTRRLNSLRPGQRATVASLDNTVQGFTRRRLLDLGMTPGTSITAELSSFARDPIGYRLRGSLIALRAEQAAHILVHVDGNGGGSRA